MQRESVEAAVSVQPSLGVSLLWNGDATSVSIVPDEHWAPSTYYTVSVGPGALATTGRPMTQPVRAAFLTRDPTSAALAASSTVQKRVAIDSAFTVAFDQAVDLGSVAPSIRLDPPAPGALTRTLDAAGLPTYTFKPAAPLLPDTRYRLIVDGARDAAGAAVAPTTIAVRTVKAPAVVRFRPRTAMTDVARDAAISVRFTQKMDRASTKQAFKVSAGGQGRRRDRALRRERHGPRLRSVVEPALRRQGRQPRSLPPRRAPRGSRSASRPRAPSRSYPSPPPPARSRQAAAAVAVAAAAVAERSGAAAGRPWSATT